MDDALTGAAYLIHRLEDLVDYFGRNRPITVMLVGEGIVLFLWWLVKK